MALIPVKTTVTSCSVSRHCYGNMSWITTHYVKYPTRSLHLGHQKLSQDEIHGVVERLSLVKDDTKRHEPVLDEVKKCRKLRQDDIDVLVNRLSKEKRNQDDEIKNEKTIATSYAWCNGKLLHFHPKPLDGTWH